MNNRQFGMFWCTQHPANELTNSTKCLALLGVTKSVTESLILAQDERWRRA